MKENTKLKIGFQTITWGDDFPINCEVITKLKKLKIDGIEIAQPLLEKQLVESIEKIKGSGLELSGLAGGSLLDRVATLSRLPLELEQPSYLYYSGSKNHLNTTLKSIAANESMRSVVDKSRISVHPYQYRGIEKTTDFESIERSNDSGIPLMFLPDVAHLYLAGENVLEALKRNKEKISAIHLKDWSPNQGRNYFTYSRGFCQLGAGILSETGILQEVREWILSEYTGWVIFEIDHADGNHFDTIERSIDWWNEPETFRQPPKFRLAPAAHKRERLHQDADTVSSQVAMRLITTVGASLSKFYGELVLGVKDDLNCKYVNVWEVDTKNHELIMKASSLMEGGPNKMRDEAVKVIPLADCLISDVITAGRPKTFLNISNEALRVKFKDPNLLSELELQGMISLPVRNNYNRDQIVIVLNCFWDEQFPEIQLPTMERTLGNLEPSLSYIYQMVFDGAKAQIFEDLNTRSTSRISYNEMLEFVCMQAKEYVECDEIAVFSYDESLDLAKCEIAPVEVPRMAMAKFSPDESVLRRAIRDKEIVLVSDRQTIKNSFVLRKFFSSMSAFIIKPAVNEIGSVRGFTICGRKARTGSNKKSERFTFSDDAILDFVYLATKEKFRSVLAYSSSLNTMRKIRHEMKHPAEYAISTTREIQELIRGRRKIAPVFIKLIKRRLISLKELGLNETTERVSEEWLRSRLASEGERIDSLIFKVAEKLLEDVVDYETMLLNKIEELSFFRSRFELKPDLRHIHHLQSEIFIPVKNHCRKLLEHEGLPSEYVERIHVDARELGELYVDKKLWTHLTFNMIENAVKYRCEEIERFRVSIRARRLSSGSYEIVFEDYGTGVGNAEEAKLIFDDFYRSPRAEMYVTGEGIGLSMVKKIVECHGGTIGVENFYNPTRFVINLPAERRYPKRSAS